MKSELEVQDKVVVDPKEAANPLTHKSQRAEEVEFHSTTELEGVKAELITLRKAVEASGEVIFLTDREGIITYVNPEFTRLYGYHADEVVGRTTPRILKSGMMTAHDYEQLWETLLNKQVVKRDFINRCKAGDSLP